jgi:hypothetical protein
MKLLTILATMLIAASVLSVANVVQANDAAALSGHRLDNHKSPALRRLHRGDGDGHEDEDADGRVDQLLMAMAVFAILAVVLAVASALSVDNGVQANVAPAVSDRRLENISHITPSASPKSKSKPRYRRLNGGGDGHYDEDEDVTTEGDCVRGDNEGGENGGDHLAREHGARPSPPPHPAVEID